MNAGPPLLAAALINLVLGLVVLVSTWKVFVKAGRPGWASVLPVYNLAVLFQVAGKPASYGVVLFFCGVGLRLVSWFLEPGWATLLIVIPLLVMTLGLSFAGAIALAAKFDKSPAFGIGTVFLP